MAKFTTRVVLHDVDNDESEEYTDLHEEMAKEGYVRTIKSGDDKTYKLPPAEYNLIGDFTVEQARDKAVAAAKRAYAGKHSVLTTKGERAWSGLEEIK